MSANPAQNGERHDPDERLDNGVFRYPYLCWEGGPHLLIPCSCAENWTGCPPDEDFLRLDWDYGRACAATDPAEFGQVAVGTETALVFSTDIFSSWGISRSDEFEIYVLRQLADLDPDDLLDLARETVVVSDFYDLDVTFRLQSPGAYLMWSGDTLHDPICEVFEVPIPAGEYRIAAHSFQTAGDWVDIYRLIPVERYEEIKDELGGWARRDPPA